MTYKWTQMIYNDLQNISDVSLPESQVIMYVLNDNKVYSKYTVLLQTTGAVLTKVSQDGPMTYLCPKSG